MLQDLLAHLGGPAGPGQGPTLKVVTLGAVLLFFALVSSLRALLRWDLSPSKVGGTIRLRVHPTCLAISGCGAG